MTEHELTLIESGNWIATVTEEGLEYHDHNTVETVEAKCSCGKEFGNAVDAFNHLEDVKGDSNGS